MTLDKIEECNCPEEQSQEVSKKEMDGECEVGYHKDDEGKCVKDEAPAEESENQKILKKLEQIQTDYSSFKGHLDKLKTLEAEAGVRKPQPTAKVSSGNEPFSMAKVMEKVHKWLESDRDSSCTVTIPVDVLRGVNTKRVNTRYGVQEVYRNGYESQLKINEALGYTGTQSTDAVDPAVAMEPGGFSYLPITQFAKYKELKQGENLARFFKHDLPAPATQTPGTTATVGTMDIESIEVTPSTITGVHLEVDTDDIENNPYDTVGVVVKASAARFDDFIATDMLDTVSAEGTLTPLRWIKASDGSTITSSDTASVSMDSLGIAKGVAVLRNQGLLQGGVKPVCVMHPDQYEDLLTDTGITNFTQFANPGITQNGEIGELYGCRIVVSNAVQINSAQTNTAQNALMFIPNHSYGVASGRNVTVKFHEIPEDNQIWVTTNWRIKSGVIDANSIIRLSSTQ